MIVVVMLYLSMVLIGRRHWFTRPATGWRWPATSSSATLALVVIAVGLIVVFAAPRPARAT